MSRAHLVDNSAAVSLFPFLAVLLCTMGALLVVLVAMTRSAREVALRQAAVYEQPPPSAEADPANREKLAQIKLYLARLNEARAESQRALREEHQRLSHLEEHMRRLREQLQKLQIAALELETLEEEHYDDRAQAEREVARLQQLIADTRTAIEALKEEQNTNQRSYALVPYEGPNGTSRRPIYIECRDGELVLQPEGVRLTVDDLRPPVGAGNPLAAALRAAREHLRTLHPNGAIDRDTEPYPLVIVRPSGAAMFSPAQRAIQSGDFDFGYELVEEEWDLKYPPADPQLAAVEQQAIDQARVRQQALAAAAPRAYRHPRLAAAGRFEFDGIESGGLGFVESGMGAGGAAMAGSFGAGGGTGESEGASEGQGTGPGGPAVPSQGGLSASQNAAARGTTADGTGAANENAPAIGDQAGQSPSGSAVAGATSGEAGGTAAGQSSPGATTGNQADASVNTGSQQFDAASPQAELAATRGADWALKRKGPRAVPVRRTIQIVVRKDHLAVLSDDVSLNARSPAGTTIPLIGDTVQAIDEFVKVVNQQIEGWGMAGDGLYWRPVLAVHVGPDGQRRAQDLARLLKNSGLELQSATAQSNPQGSNRATR